MSLRLAANQSQKHSFPCADFTLFSELAREFNMSPASDDEIEQSLRLATDLIGAQLTPPPVLKALQRAFPASVMVYVEDGAVTGVYAFLLVRPEKMDAIWRGTLDALNLDLELSCREGDRIGGGYSLGFAGCTDAGRRAVVGCSQEMARRVLAGGAPTFSRAATAVGRHIVVEKMGYRPLPEAPDIYWMSPEAAA